MQVLYEYYINKYEHMQCHEWCIKTASADKNAVNEKSNLNNVSKTLSR